MCIFPGRPERGRPAPLFRSIFASQAHPPRPPENPDQILEHLTQVAGLSLCTSVMHGKDVSNLGTGPEELGRENSMTHARELLFEELVRRQSRFLFRLAHAVLRNTHDAEDAVQEVFLKIYRGGAWDEIEDEKAFLVTRCVARCGLEVAGKAAPTGEHSTFLDEKRSKMANPEQSAIDADVACYRSSVDRCATRTSCGSRLRCRAWQI